MAHVHMTTMRISISLSTSKLRHARPSTGFIAPSAPARTSSRGPRNALRVFATAGKIALVTGANTGMGKYTAEMLAREGYEVLLACRDKEKGTAAAKEIAAATGGTAEFIQLDLSSLESVNSCCEKLLAEGRPISRLVNNAGIMACPPWTTKDGFESQMGTNHLGHFALTLQILPLLQEASKSGEVARVVNVASAAHTGCKELTMGSLAQLDEPNYVPWGAYGASKAANILFTRELAKRLKAENINITANALCPGLVATDLGRYFVEGSKWYMKPVVALIVPYMMSKAKSIPDGASTALFLATSQEVEGISGEYFVDSEIKTSSELTQDMKLAEQLWEASEKLTGVQL